MQIDIKQIENWTIFLTLWIIKIYISFIPFLKPCSTDRDHFWSKPNKVLKYVFLFLSFFKLLVSLKARFVAFHLEGNIFIFHTNPIAWYKTVFSIFIKYIKEKKKIKVLIIFFIESNTKTAYFIRRVPQSTKEYFMKILVGTISHANEGLHKTIGSLIPCMLPFAYFELLHNLTTTQALPLS